jgi:hypothetical protein
VPASQSPSLDRIEGALEEDCRLLLRLGDASWKEDASLMKGNWDWVNRGESSLRADESKSGILVSLLRMFRFGGAEGI